MSIETPPASPSVTEGNRWWTSWPAIVVGFVLYAIPGAVLLWLRRGPGVPLKIVTSILAVPLFVTMIGATVAGEVDRGTGAIAASPSPSALVPDPSPSASLVVPDPPAPSITPEPSPAATPDASPAPAAASDHATGRVAADDRSAYSTAREATLALTVKGRAPKTGYARNEFGSGWVDVDRNGCDTRNDMLILRLTDRDMSGRCRVEAGTLADPFTATSIRFVRGGASEVDIDHLVALSDAWQKGAAQWEFAKRVAFANDPLNLEPVDSSANRQKGDGDAATWLPANKDYRCHYVARQVAVKTKYGLWVTQAEQDAILRVLDACPGEPLPSEGDQPVIATNTGAAPPQAKEPAAPKETTAPQPKPKPKPEPQATTDKRYPYCKDLPAGLGPYVRGVDPEYEWYTDRDGDGVVCE